jgi:hypothetical protein
MLVLGLRSIIIANRKTIAKCRRYKNAADSYFEIEKRITFEKHILKTFKTIKKPWIQQRKKQ